MKINFLKFIKANLFVIFLLFLSFKAYSKNCYLEPENCTENEITEVYESMDQFMYFSQPEFTESIYNISNPLEITYDLPSNFQLKKKMIFPMNPVNDINLWLENNINFDDTGDKCQAGYSRTSYGCGSVKVNDKFEVENNIKVNTKSKNDFIELKYFLNPNEFVWNWSTITCLFEAITDEDVENCYIKSNFKNNTIETRIKKNGMLVNETNNFQNNSLIKLTTPEFNRSSINTVQGNLLYNYKVKENFNFTFNGQKLSDWVENLDARVIGKINYKNRNCLLIDLEFNTNKNWPKFDTGTVRTEGFQIIDINTGLMLYSKYNMLMMHPGINISDPPAPVLVLFEQEINF